MATKTTTPYTFKGGEALPQVGSEAYIQAQQGLKPTASYSSTITPPPVTSTITSSTVGVNQNPINLSPIMPATGAAGLGAEITSNINSQTQDFLTAQTEAKANSAKSGLDTSRDALMKELGLQTGKTSLTDSAYGNTNDLGTSVDTSAKALKDVNNKINAIDIRANAEIQSLKGKFSGTSAGYNDAISTIERNASLDKANLYIDKLVAQGDYETAKSIADRKVDVALEQQKLNLDKLTFDYQENKDLFNKDEQRSYELMLDNRKRQLEQTQTTQKDFEKTKIDLLRSANEQGAPQAIKDAIMRATNTAEAVNAAGIYSGNILDNQYKQAQINKMRTDAVQAARALDPKIATRVQTIAGQFDNEPAVRAYQTSAEAIDAVRNAGVTPTDDIQRVYAFAKVMDPNSAVKEGEYKTVQDYATAVIERTGLKAKRIFDNTGFLTEEARNFMLNTLENRLSSSKKAYDNIYKSYGDRINKVTGSTDGGDYITDYSEAFKNTATTKTVTSNGKEYSIGQVYQDGSGAKWTVDANGKWTKQ